MEKEMLFTQSGFEFEPTSYIFDFERLELTIKRIDSEKNVAVEVKGNCTKEFFEKIKDLLIKTSFGLIHSENINKLGKIEIDAELLSQMVKHVK